MLNFQDSVMSVVTTADGTELAVLQNSNVDRCSTSQSPPTLQQQQMPSAIVNQFPQNGQMIQQPQSYVNHHMIMNSMYPGFFPQFGSGYPGVPVQHHPGVPVQQHQNQQINQQPQFQTNTSSQNQLVNEPTQHQASNYDALPRNQLYENPRPDLEAMKRCIVNNKLRCLEFGQLCSSWALQNYPTYALALRKFLKEESSNIFDFVITQEYYKPENSQASAACNALMVKILAQNQNEMKKKQMKDAETLGFKRAGSTNNVVTQLQCDLMPPFKANLFVKITDLPAPESSTPKGIIMHYTLNWLLKCVDDAATYKAYTVTSLDFLIQEDRSSEEIGEEEGGGGEEEEEEEEEEERVAESPSSSSKKQKYLDLPRSLKANLFQVLLEFFDLHCPLLSQKHNISPEEIQKHPNFLAMGQNWDERVRELTERRKTYKAFRDMFLKVLINAGTELRNGKFDEVTKKFIRRERRSKSRLDAKKKKTE